MQEDINLKQTADEIMKIDGKIRGETILNRMDYIRDKKGDKGVEAVEKKLKELGSPLEYKKVKSLSWYSEANSILIILVAQELFDWNEEDIFNMGYNATRISFIVKLLMKYFISLEKTFKISPKNWEKHHSVGSISHINYKRGENKLTFRLNNYNFHSIMCSYLRGYFLGIAELVIKNKDIKVKEIRCMFKSDPYHEFEFKWE